MRPVLKVLILTAAWTIAVVLLPLTVLTLTAICAWHGIRWAYRRYTPDNIWDDLEEIW